MDWIAVFIICTNFITLQAKYKMGFNTLAELIKRRDSMHRGPVLGSPKYPEHLPDAEPILPGHSLIRPAQGMLKSAVKFPLRDIGGTLVYGNADNIGISYGNTNERVLYTDFRKANNLLAALENIIEISKKRKNHSPIIIIEMNQNNPKESKSKSLLEVSVPEEDNDARETLDEIDHDKFVDDNSYDVDFRRRKKSKSKFRKRSYERSSTEGDSMSTSGSSEYEKNPGNPYTVHKNKYKQNWLWNHFMDGDHMNVNPYAPETKSLGPPGQDLFFGRKWWYFNQDDYKPM